MPLHVDRIAEVRCGVRAMIYHPIIKPRRQSPPAAPLWLGILDKESNNIACASSYQHTKAQECVAKTMYLKISSPEIYKVQQLGATILITQLFEANRPIQV